MKLRKSHWVALAVLSWASMQANATLVVRGVDSHGNQLVYDSASNLTWYDFSYPLGRWPDYQLSPGQIWNDYLLSTGGPPPTWQVAVDWAAALTVSGGGLARAYDDWRLPSAVNDASLSGPGNDISGSEMGRLFLVALGNQRTNCSVLPPYCLSLTGPFQNLSAMSYWQGTEGDTAYAWLFTTSFGNLGLEDKNNMHLAMAVRDGDVVVDLLPPGQVSEPASVALSGLGLAGIAVGLRTRRQVAVAEALENR